MRCFNITTELSNYFCINMNNLYGRCLYPRQVYTYDSSYTKLTVEDVLGSCKNCYLMVSINAGIFNMLRSVIL